MDSNDFSINDLKKGVYADLNDKQFAALVCQYFLSKSKEETETFDDEMLEHAFAFMSSAVLRLMSADKEKKFTNEFMIKFMELTKVDPHSAEFSSKFQALLSIGCVFLAKLGSSDPLCLDPKFNKTMMEYQLMQKTQKSEFDPDRLDMEIAKQYPANIVELMN